MNAEALSLSAFNTMFPDEEAARRWFERARWPDGPVCPHCGEVIVTTADTSQGDYATIEDCEVCCAPMNIEVICEPGLVKEVNVSPA